MPLSSDEEKELARLQKLKADAEKEQADAESAAKEAEKKKKDALAAGDKEGAREAAREGEIARVSESTAHALLEEVRELKVLLEEKLREKGVSQADIDAAKTRARRKIGRSAL